MSESSQKKFFCSEAFMSMVGAVLIKLSTSVITCWGNINLYYLSYFREKEGHTITTSTNSVIILIALFPMIIGMLMSPYLCNRFGFIFITRVCAFVFLISPLIMNINFSMYVFVFFCLVLPTLAFAVCTIPVLNCIWTQFPNSKNKITSVVVFAYGLGFLIWNLVFMYMVNP